MRKYVLALSIAAMIGGLGFAGAASAADPPTAISAPVLAAAATDVQAPQALPALATVRADAQVILAFAGPVPVYRPGMTAEEFRAAVLQRVANPQPCNCGPRWRS